MKLLAIAATEKLCYPALTHLLSREKQVSFSKPSWAARYGTYSDGILEPTLKNSLTFWPQIQRLTQSQRYQLKTQNPYFQEGLKVEHLKRQIMHQRRLKGEERAVTLGPSRDQQQSWQTKLLHCMCHSRKSNLFDISHWDTQTFMLQV